jgi:hypothetical protein
MIIDIGFIKNLSICGKNSARIPKDFLKNSQRNVTRDSSGNL